MTRDVTVEPGVAIGQRDSWVRKYALAVDVGQPVGRGVAVVVEEVVPRPGAVVEQLPAGYSAATKARVKIVGAPADRLRSCSRRESRPRRLGASSREIAACRLKQCHHRWTSLNALTNRSADCRCAARLGGPGIRGRRHVHARHAESPPGKHPARVVTARQPQLRIRRGPHVTGSGQRYPWLAAHRRRCSGRRRR
jgi:hypothetical protein